MLEILKQLDESVFTDELKAELSEKFEAAVDEKSELRAQEIVAEKEIEYEAYIAEESEKAKAELLEQLSEYMEEVFEENKIAIDESIDVERTKAVLEGFDALLTTVGVEVSKIQEAKADDSLEAKVEELEAKVDEAINDKLELVKENKELTRMGLIAESSEGLSITEKEKFIKMADLVEANEMNESFVAKLDAIKETVLDKKVETPSEEVVEKAIEIEDEVIVEKVVESKRYGSHLV